MAASTTREDMSIKLQAMQVALYVAIEGGMLASFAIRQPWDFYIDTRVRRGAFSKRRIMRAVQQYADQCLLEGYAVGPRPWVMPEGDALLSYPSLMLEGGR